MAVKERKEKPEMTQNEFAEFLEKNTSTTLEGVDDFKGKFGFNPFEKTETTQEKIRKTFEKRCFYNAETLDRSENPFKRGIFVYIKNNQVEIVNIKDVELYKRITELFRFALK